MTVEGMKYSIYFSPRAGEAGQTVTYYKASGCLSGSGIKAQRVTSMVQSRLKAVAGPRMSRVSGSGEPNRNVSDQVITKTKPKTKRPNLYRVLLLNDDYTPMEFVVHILERFFNKDRDQATEVMLHVHNNGVGECGIFTYEVAETKVTQVMDFARRHQHPLQCVMEKK
jgi:ATP-dependent Clp protease adaptor protein ClpS